MRKCCEGDGPLLYCLMFLAFSLTHRIARLSERSSKLCKSSRSVFLVHILSLNKTLVRPPRGTLWILGALRPQANVLGISEQVGAPEVSVQDPSSYGHIPAFTNPIPIYGQIESTALWSAVSDQRLRI